MELSRSEQADVRLGQRSVMSLQASLLCIDLRMLEKYFSCSMQLFLMSLNCSQLGSQFFQAASSKRQRYLSDFLRTLRAILRAEYWNLMMKQTKSSSLFWPMVNSLRMRQNSLAIQLATMVTFLRQSTQPRMLPILSEKQRDSHSSLQLARSLSSQMRVSEMILAMVRSVFCSTSIQRPSVIFLMRVRVLWAREARLSMNGWFPQQMKQRRQPADHTSHLKEYFQFLSCSGEAQMGVPLSRLKLSILEISVWLTLRAQPKSATLMTMPLPMRMFSGLRSRWKTPLTFMTMKACTICLKMRSISWTDSCLFFFLKQLRRSPSSQYSMMISSSSLLSSKWLSQILTRLGCTNFFITSISFSACSTSKGSTCIFFSAYDRSLLSLIRQTLPKLPSPIRSIDLYCINRTLQYAEMNRNIYFPQHPIRLAIDNRSKTCNNVENNQMSRSRGGLQSRPKKAKMSYSVRHVGMGQSQTTPFSSLGTAPLSES